LLPSSSETDCPGKSHSVFNFALAHLKGSGRQKSASEASATVCFLFGIPFLYRKRGLYSGRVSFGDKVANLTVNGKQASVSEPRVIHLRNAWNTDIALL
jgi:hypothetical protein